MDDVYTRPVEILQQLIQFDTTNPPGNEAVLIEWVAKLLRENGIEPVIVGKSPIRTNLFARLKGRGDAPPLLLYGHVDVVTTADQTWTHPPFSGDIIDGYVWGRGALDMKGGCAMLISAFLRAKAENLDLPCDLILCLGADEEASGAWGVKYLVEEHAALFGGAKVCISEFGAFPLYVAGKRFYPIMVTERYVHTLKATIRGAGGHGAMRQTGTAMGRLGRLLSRLDGARLPVHITPVVRALVEGVAAELDEPAASGLRALLDPSQTDAALEQLGPAARLFDPLLHNTVNPTMVSGGHKINVIPSEIVLRMDGRVLPGISPETFMDEVRAVVDDDQVVIEPNETEPPDALIDPDMSHFQMLADVLKAADPSGTPVPYMVSGATDARVLSKLGIQTYGFLPMNLPPEFNFAATIHAADERIPVGAVGFGADAIYEAIRRYGHV